MQRLYCFLLFLIPLSAGAAEQLACPALIEERFTEAEIEALRKGDSSFNALVREALAYKQKLHEEIDQQFRAADFDRAEKIDWEQAKRLILNGLVVLTVQSHKRNVLLVTRSGSVYESTETQLDEVDAIVRKVDPCGILIKSITE